MGDKFYTLKMLGINKDTRSMCGMLEREQPGGYIGGKFTAHYYDRQATFRTREKAIKWLKERLFGYWVTKKESQPIFYRGLRRCRGGRR